MKIMILEDDSDDRENLTHLLQVWLLQNNDELFQIRALENASEFLKEFRKEPAEIVFLDIYLEDKTSGLKVAEAIQEIAPQCAVIFTTTSTDFALEGFELNAIHYCVKPISLPDIEECMRRCREKIHWEELAVTLTAGSKTYMVPLNRILYAVSEDHYIVFHFMDGTLEPLRVRIGISEAEKLLQDSRFLRVSRSYIINMDYVEDLLDAVFQMQDGTEIPMGRRGRSELRTAYESYIFHRMRSG